MDQEKINEKLPAVKTDLSVIDTSLKGADAVINKIDIIKSLYEKVLIKDIHYGVIPGTGKPSLYKAGAEQIAFMFNWSNQIEATTIDLGEGHMRVDVKCTLTNRSSLAFIGQGIGSCSTKETKYCYRTIKAEPVPSAYWDDRSNPKWEGKKTKKFDGKWCFYTQEPNPCIADTYNTVLKMAKKRAYIDAILTNAGVSDMFTQDIEDMFNNEEELSKTPSNFVNQQKPSLDPIKLAKYTRAMNKCDKVPGLSKKILTQHNSERWSFLPESVIDELLADEKKEKIIEDNILTKTFPGNADGEIYILTFDQKDKYLISKKIANGSVSSLYEIHIPTMTCDCLAGKNHKGCKHIKWAKEFEEARNAKKE